MRTGAHLSADGVYRYALWRDQRDSLDEPITGFIMLNPSTADADVDDQTIRKCVRFAEIHGSRAIVVLNLFAFRARDPKDLEAAHRSGVDIIGPDNRYFHRSYQPALSTIVAAWGAHRLAAYGVDEMSHLWRQRFQCLGVTRDGAPRHPCYLGYDTPLIPFQSPWAHDGVST
jgi:hypothetical protein